MYIVLVAVGVYSFRQKTEMSVRSHTRTHGRRHPCTHFHLYTNFIFIYAFSTTLGLLVEKVFWSFLMKIMCVCPCFVDSHVLWSHIMCMDVNLFIFSPYTHTDKYYIYVYGMRLWFLVDLKWIGIENATLGAEHTLTETHTGMCTLVLHIYVKTLERKSESERGRETARDMKILNACTPH